MYLHGQCIHESHTRKRQSIMSLCVLIGWWRTSGSCTIGCSHVKEAWRNIFRNFAEIVQCLASWRQRFKKNDFSCEVWNAYSLLNYILWYILSAIYFPNIKCYEICALKWHQKTKIKFLWSFGWEDLEERAICKGALEQCTSINNVCVPSQAPYLLCTSWGIFNTPFSMFLLW